MPDANGQLYFTDFKAELQRRGFDGFSDTDLGTYVNRGYFAVARKARWYWEQTTDAFTVAVGAATVDLWPAASGELPQFRSLDKLYVTTAGQERKLTPMDPDEFFNQWLHKDLTATTYRGEPTSYAVWAGKLYILPPPSASRTFLAHYHRRVTALVNANDLPITPIHLDEAILDAARVRAHMRANEPALSALARADLEEAFDDMRDDEAELVDELPERVRPDDQWL